MSSRSVCTHLVLLFLFFTASVLAQEFRGAVTGTVTDQAGAVVAGATVTATNIETNVATTAKTNDSGVYTFPFLSLGHYNVTASAPGFKQELRSNIDLRVGDRLKIDFRMELGAVNESITVTSEAELLETSSATHGQVIDQASVRDLPLLGRNPFMLTLLSTGVTWPNIEPANSERPWDNNGMDSFQINGSQGLVNNYLLDGLPNTNVENTGPANITVAPSPDATSEFKVQTNSYDAEYGRTGGGTVNVTLKSGTNKLHGALYDYERNTIFNANLFQNNAAHIPRPAFRWHQPGAEFDGPIYIPKVYDGRNHTFFMADWEGVSLIQPGTNIDTVPTPAERQGNFSGLVQSNGQPITIYDPTSTHLVNGQNIRNAFPGNVIPANLLNPTALAIQNFIPLPNAPGTSTGLNNLIVPTYNKVGYTQIIARIDQYISERERLSARFERNGDTAPGGPTGYLGPLATGAGYARKNRGGGFDLTSTLSPTLILVSRAGYERHMWEYMNPGVPFPLAALGISPGLIAQLPAQTFPSISMTNYTSFGPGRNIGDEFNYSGTWSWSETFSKVTGPHSMKFGSEFWVMLNNQQEPTSTFGTASFTNAWTQQNALTASASSGNAYASFLLGYPASGTEQYNQAMAYSSHYYALFFQDDWRVNSKLSLNLGIRWDYESPITERHNRLDAGFDPNATYTITGVTYKGGLQFVNATNRLPFVRDLSNWQPRLGFAYQMFHNTVLRGGYGISYLPTFDLPGLNGFDVATSMTSSINGGLTPAPRFSLSNPYPNGIVQPTGSSLGPATLVGQGFTVGDHQRVIPYVHQFSFGLQQLLPLKAVAGISYVGSRTRELQATRSINAISAQQLQLGNALNSTVPNQFPTLPQTLQQSLLPYPQFGTINESVIPIGYTSFDSLQAKIEKRFSHGLHALLSYTWQKTLTGTSYLNAQDPFYDLARSFARYDQPFRTVLSGGYEFPGSTSGNWFMRNVVAGWQVNLIATWQGGEPIAMPDGYTTGVNPALPASQQSLNEFFNTCTLSTTGVRENCISADQPVAWIVRPAFTLRVTDLYFPNIRTNRPFVMDSSLFRAFRLTERAQLQFRLEAFNTFNTVWFNGPSTGIATSSFGVVSPSQANDPRFMQLGARIMF